MRKMPQIKSVMTPFPYSIAPTASVEQAREMMREHDIRHLPVCENHRVVGVVSDRDLRVALGVRPGERELEVAEVCGTEPYLVELDRSLHEVASEMAARRLGSAIVMRGDKLAGILTTTDVCRLLAKTLQEAYGDQDDDVA